MAEVLRKGGVVIMENNSVGCMGGTSQRSIGPTCTMVCALWR